MNLKERIQTVLQKLNLLDKAKANQLTQEEWGQIVNSYNQEYQSILQDDLAADQAAQRQTVAVTQEQIDQVQSILGSIVNPVQTNSTATEEENSGNGPVQTISQPANGEGLVQLATAVQSLVDNMNNRAEDDIPSRTVTAASIMFTGPADRSRYLFGIETRCSPCPNVGTKLLSIRPPLLLTVHGMKRLKGPLSVTRPLLSPVHCSSVTIICTETACLTPNVWQPENSVRTTKGWIQPVWATSMWFCVRTI